MGLTEEHCHRYMVKNSKHRTAILEILKSTTSHPSADWIYDRVKREMPNISLGTVYRNLRLLKQDGKIAEFSFDNGMGRFDARVEHHYHFVCRSCNSIFDLDEPVNSMLDKSIAQSKGFTVKGHRLYFYGLCNNCQKVNK